MGANRRGKGLNVEEITFEECITGTLVNFSIIHLHDSQSCHYYIKIPLEECNDKHTLLDPGTLGGSWGRFAMKGDCFLLGGTLQYIIYYCSCSVMSFIIVKHQ